MNRLIAVAGAHKVLTAAAALLVTVGVAQVATGDDSTTATVDKIVDGDTIDVSYDGETHRVRLLNVDTPESVDPDQPVQCLGAEATEYLRGRLPLGSTVRLVFDEERQDQYDRELAGVFVGDSLVNADIAREGLGVAMSVAPNTRFLAQVSAAQAEAQAMGRGLYDPAVGCTLPAQLAAVETAGSPAQPVPADAGLEALDSRAAELLVAAAAAQALAGVLDGDHHVFPLVAFPASDLLAMQARVDTVDRAVTAAQASIHAARVVEEQRIAAEKAAAEKAAAERVAAEEAARRAAEEAARQAAEQAAREAAEAAAQQAAQDAARQAATKARASSASPAPSRASAPTAGSSGSGSSSSAGTSGGSGTSSSGGADTYTGCRAYGSGGTSIDAKGRPYTKIDCTTKRPIG